MMEGQTVAGESRIRRVSKFCEDLPRQGDELVSHIGPDCVADALFA